MQHVFMSLGALVNWVVSNRHHVPITGTIVVPTSSMREREREINPKASMIEGRYPLIIAASLYVNWEWVSKSCVVLSQSP